MYGRFLRYTWVDLNVIFPHFRSPMPCYAVEMAESLIKVVAMVIAAGRLFARSVVVGNCTGRSVTVLHDANLLRHTPCLHVLLISGSG